eukprot:gb/GECG01014105.1/.p1 GENE.gb/GECG01014105.1/~~gb/GECG01014105.1/.p1  ORF type:complete len:115 (+),score=12.99 gb/GECG01014105.1/:1-345(+)
MLVVLFWLICIQRLSFHRPLTNHREDEEWKQLASRIEGMRHECEEHMGRRTQTDLPQAGSASARDEPSLRFPPIYGVPYLHSQESVETERLDSLEEEFGRSRRGTLSEKKCEQT